MKLECSKKSLLNAINIVSKAVSTRSTLPILTVFSLQVIEKALDFWLVIEN